MMLTADMDVLRHTDSEVWDRAFGVFCESKLTLDKIPTVDAVPVVRCRYCKFNLANIEELENIYDGWNACSLTELYDSVFPDDFCSKGERREEKNDNA